jgi:hypothetical protein
MLRITRSAELSAGLGSRANRGAQRCKERNCFGCLRMKVRRPRFLTIRATFPPALSVAFLFASQPEPLRYFCPIFFPSDSSSNLKHPHPLQTSPPHNNIPSRSRLIHDGTWQRTRRGSQEVPGKVGRSGGLKNAPLPRSKRD